MNKTYTVTLLEGENDDVILPIPEELMLQLGWKDGDTMVWTDNKDGSFNMNKKIETELVLVECIQTYRIRYLVEVPVSKSDWALDTVAMQPDDLQEFSQLSLGETIISNRVINRTEALVLCNDDNDYAQSWSDEKKLEVFTHTWKE